MEMKAPKIKVGSESERLLWDEILASLIKCYTRQPKSLEPIYKIELAKVEEEEYYREYIVKVLDVADFKTKYKFVVGELEKESVKEEKYEEAVIYRDLLRFVEKEKAD